MYAPKEHTGARRGMPVLDLIATLTEIAEMHGDNTIVRLMTHESWPFENAIRGVAVSTDFGSDDADPECYPKEALTDEDGVPICVYIVEGDQIGYGSRDAWNVV